MDGAYFIGFTFGGINFADSSFRGFSLNVYAEEQVCQITTRITPTDRSSVTEDQIAKFRGSSVSRFVTAPPATSATPDGRVVDLSDDALLEVMLDLIVETQPSVRVIEE